jgi:hypothetical protein
VGIQYIISLPWNSQNIRALNLSHDFCVESSNLIDLLVAVCMLVLSDPGK